MYTTPSKKRLRLLKNFFLDIGEMSLVPTCFWYPQSEIVVFEKFLQTQTFFSYGKIWLTSSKSACRFPNKNLWTLGKGFLCVIVFDVSREVWQIKKNFYGRKFFFLWPNTCPVILKTVLTTFQKKKIKASAQSFSCQNVFNVSKARFLSLKFFYRTQICFSWPET